MCSTLKKPISAPRCLRIASDFEKSFRTGTEQEIVDDLLVLQHQWRQLARKCEDHVHVARREKFSLTRGDPTFPSSGLTLRAVAITAAVVRDGAMSAAGAFIEMSAECSGTTPRNGQQHFDMLPADPLAVSFDECCLPRARMRSATSRGGRLIYSFCVDRLSASASPADWRSRADDAGKDAGRWWSLSDRDGLTGSEWCADPRPLRADAWRNSGAACADGRLS